MLTLMKFSAKMAYDAACISVGTVIMWKKELEDLGDRGWFHPEAAFETVSMQDMNH